MKRVDLEGIWGGVFKLCACVPVSQGPEEVRRAWSNRVRGVSSYSFPTSVPLGQGPPNHTFPFPGLATQKITVTFSELALDAKLAFSILHKIQETVATCLREELLTLHGLFLSFEEL